MRFALRFNNGFWTTFDTHAYRPVRLHYTKKAGVADVGRRNG